MTTKSGRCLCGAYRYSFDGEPLKVANCYCTHCQRHGGSLVAVNVAVLQSSFRSEGTLLAYHDTGDSGATVSRHFCGTCGSTVLTTVEAAPHIVIVKAGTLDDASGLTPTLEVYAEHAPDWMSAPPGATRFDRTPVAAGAAKPE